VGQVACKLLAAFVVPVV